MRGPRAKTLFKAQELTQDLSQKDEIKNSSASSELMKMQLVSSSAFRRLSDVCGDIWLAGAYTNNRGRHRCREEAGSGRAGGQAGEVRRQEAGERKEGGSLGDVRLESMSASSFGSVIKKRINERQTRTLLRVPQQLASPGKVCAAAAAQEGAQCGRAVPHVDSLSLRIRLQLRELPTQFTAYRPKIPPFHFFFSPGSHLHLSVG